MLTGLLAVAILAGLVLFLLFVPKKDAMNTPQQSLSPAQYQAEFVSGAQPHLLLDVRTHEEFAGGHLLGAVNISLQALPQRLAEVPHDRPVVIYCRSGNRSKQASHLLAAAGYDQLYDLGGIIEWQAQGLPVH
ncbi:MAG: rhodanese-like domain-containing protein [Caldilineaceae bacterium]|nr:rhodanese-like domain-containing protein [Caldilineaceae bacterium]